jgi:hypothetical protein
MGLEEFVILCKHFKDLVDKVEGLGVGWGKWPGLRALSGRLGPWPGRTAGPRASSRPSSAHPVCGAPQVLPPPAARGDAAALRAAIARAGRDAGAAADEDDAVDRKMNPRVGGGEGGGGGLKGPRPA